MMTDEDLQAYLSMGDISEQEKQRQLQVLLGQQLRSAGSSIPVQRGRAGLGGNIGRATYGIAGALGDYQGLTAGAGITKAKQDLFAKLLRMQQSPGKEWED